jgi:hypothetical protein
MVRGFGYYKIVPVSQARAGWTPDTAKMGRQIKSVEKGCKTACLQKKLVAAY